MATLQYSLPGSSDVHTAKVDAPKSKTSCGILLGHGAGGDSNSGHLPKIAQAFSDAGILCIRLNCKPPNLARRVAHAKACLLSAQEKFSVDCWLAAGHSMGARVASSLAHDEAELIVGTVFFSYPLHPPGKLEQLRDSPLVDLQQPVLFLRGTRDSFCEEKQFQATLKRMTSAKVNVHTVEGGDHSLKVKGGKAVTEAAVAEAIEAAVSFAISCESERQARPAKSEAPAKSDANEPEPANRQGKQGTKRKPAAAPQEDKKGTKRKAKTAKNRTKRRRKT